MCVRVKRAFDTAICNTAIVPCLKVQFVAQFSTVDAAVVEHFRHVRSGAVRAREEASIDVGAHVHGQCVASVGCLELDGDFAKAGRGARVAEVRLKSLE